MTRPNAYTSQSLLNNARYPARSRATPAPEPPPMRPVTHGMYGKVKNGSFVRDILCNRPLTDATRYSSLFRHLASASIAFTTLARVLSAATCSSAAAGAPLVPPDAVARVASTSSFLSQRAAPTDAASSPTLDRCIACASLASASLVRKSSSCALSVSSRARISRSSSRS